MARSVTSEFVDGGCSISADAESFDALRNVLPDVLGYGRKLFGPDATATVLEGFGQAAVYLGLLQAGTPLEAISGLPTNPHSLIRKDLEISPSPMLAGLLREPDYLNSLPELGVALIALGKNLAMFRRVMPEEECNRRSKSSISKQAHDEERLRASTRRKTEVDADLEEAGSRYGVKGRAFEMVEVTCGVHDNLFAHPHLVHATAGVRIVRHVMGEGFTNLTKITLSADGSPSSVNQNGLRMTIRADHSGASDVVSPISIVEGMPSPNSTILRIQHTQDYLRTVALDKLIPRTSRRVAAS